MRRHNDHSPGFESLRIMLVKKKKESPFIILITENLNWYQSLDNGSDYINRMY
jgi:hypothetical protein